jgi:hypothetical protein
MFDLRLPSGLFFAIVGALLVVMGAKDGNVNLYAGLAMFFFGAVLLLLAWRKAGKAG